jgi:hypothetical protein
MAEAKNRIDSLHDQMPAVYNTRNNANWSAIIEALGSSDEEIMQLIQSVREQFFVKTAKRPYLDRLGTANLVQRPRFIGMDDSVFRKFIPVVAYSPKQVKLILDELLDVFFFKDSTTSFAMTKQFEPFVLQDGWELEYEIDSYMKERIEFREEEFNDMSNATANEIVAAINRQSSNSYAIAFEDNLTKKINIRIFTNTVGSKGAVKVVGGKANIGLRFDGFNDDAGAGGNSEWEITKVGDTVKMRYTNVGNSPKIETLNIGDVVIITRPGNEGSFVINEVNVIDNYIIFTNLLATNNDTFTQSPTNDVRFFTPVKNNVFLKDRRAVVWEVRPGEIIVEMPPSPPIVKRNRKGAAHINGIQSKVQAYSKSLSNITLDKPDEFPTGGGQFFFIPENEIQTYFPNDGDTTYFKYNSRLCSDMPVYTYSSRVGNLIQGVSPQLPEAASLNQFLLTSANRDTNNTLTITTAVANNYGVGDFIIIEGVTLGAGSGATTNGTWKVTEVLSSTQLKAYSFGGMHGDRISTGGTVRMEKAAFSTSGGIVLMRSSKLEPRKLGPYLWNEDSDFILSSFTGNLAAEINAGSTQKNIYISSNNIPNESGQLIFNFGTERQEGPVRFFSKPSGSVVTIDPSYVFENTHNVGDSVTVIRRRGGMTFKSYGDERAPYITDPAAAREVLKELMQRVKSVGIFINFIVRYPEQYYATIDVYKSGIDPG